MAKSISRYLADISSTSGVLDGTLSTAAQTNITSLGTLSSLTVSGSAAMTLTTAAQPNITSVGTLSSLSTSGNISITGSNNELRLYEGANYVGFEAPALSADKIWVLPAADGSNGQALVTDGSGGLSFSSISAGGNAFGTIAVSGQSNVAADSNSDTLTLVAGSNITITTTPGTDTVTVAAGGGKTTEEIQDIVGAMFTSNTETRGSLTYQDGDGTIDLVVDDMTADTNTVTTINSNTNNYLITGTGTANTLQGESTLTYDGATLTVNGNQISTTNSNEWLAYNGGGSSPYLRMKTSGTNNGYIQFTTTASYIWNDRISGGFRLQTLAAPDYYDGAYRTMWHSGNAPIAVNGANNVLKANGSGYLQIDNWIRVSGGTGLYTNVSSGAYFFESTSPSGYEGWYVRSRSSGSVSLIMQQNDGTQTGHIYAGTDSNRFQQGFLKSNGGWAAKSDANANWVVTGTVYDSSDARLKSNVQPISNALTKVTQLKGVTYTRNSTMKTEIGMIAQDVKAVVPELVEIMEGEDNKYDVPDMHTLSYERVVPLLIEAIKELKTQLDAK